jgi:RND family efflux transporter MFP subunit
MVSLTEPVHVHSTTSRTLYVAFALALSAACGGGAPADGPGGPGGPGGGPPPGVPGEMVTLAAKPVERATEFVASIKSRSSTTLQPQVEGFLTRILVTPGDRVVPGTALFVVDSTTQQAGLATLQSQRAARDSDAVYARQQADRARMLLDVGATSQQEYEQAVSQAKSADAQLAAIDEQIRQQQAELAYYRVTAPTAGVIGDVPVRVGDRVTRSTELTTIDGDAGLEIYIQVPVQQAPNLRPGLPVEVSDDTGAPVASEKINFVASSVDDATQTVLAKAPLTQRDGRFRSDQLVRVRVIWNNDPALTVPLVSVLRISGQQFVYVAEPADGGGLVARLRSVTLGPVIGSDYVVVGGVSEGDRLVTSGIQKIGDGVPVQAVPAGGAPPGRGAGPGGGGGR